ncbi:MAG: cupin domain-containing protein [Solirubrobacteraceae bacterium]
MSFIDASEMTSAEPLSGWKGRFFHSENMTFATYEVDAEAVAIHEHHHPQEEVWNVTAGQIAISIDGTEQILGAGDAAVVPANAPHHARALTAATAVIVDYPVRRQIPGQAHNA